MKKMHGSRVRGAGFGVAILVAMALAWASTASAASITWGTPTTTVNEDDISLNGTLVHAGYWGADNGVLNITAGSETISFAYRGNAFTQDGSDSGSVAYMNTGYALDLADFFIPPGAVGDADFETMMDGSVVDGAGQTLLLSGLVEGISYQVQLFASDDRSSGTRTQRYGDGLGNYSTTFAQNTSSYVIGTFTADGSGTQSIVIEGVSDSGKQVFQGYVLRATAAPPGSIIWSQPTTTVNEDDIDLTYTLAHAGHWSNGSGDLSVTAGSETILFEERGKTSDGDAYVDVGAKVAAAANFFTSTGTVGDPDFETVLDGGIVDGFKIAAVIPELTLEGLTVGSLYQIQLFASDNRAGSETRTMKFGDGQASESYCATFFVDDSPYIIGTFTAAATTQTVTIVAVSDPANGGDYLNGYVLRYQPRGTLVSIR